MNDVPPAPVLADAPRPGWARSLAGVWRLTYPRFLTSGSLGVQAGALGLFALLGLMVVPAGNAEAFARWAARFYLGLLIPAHAFLAAAGIVREDLGPIATDYVLTRPIPRWRYVVFRFLAQGVCVQAQAVAGLAALAAVGLVRGIPDLAAVVPPVLAAQVLALAAFGSLGLIFGLLTGRYVVLGLVYAGVVEVGIGNIPTSVGRLSLLHHVRTIVSGSGGWGSAAAVLALAAAGLLAAAAGLFALRATPGERPKDA